MYIVLEYLLLENFIINYFILYLTKILICKDTNKSRLIIGAIISSFYSLVFFFPMLIFLTNLFAKFLISLVIIRISFKYSNINLYLKELLGFYLVSFIFAGATIGIYYSSYNFSDLLNIEVDILNAFPVKYLVLGILVSIIVSKLIFQYFNSRIVRENYIADVGIIYKKDKISIKALLDTGNSLIDPFTNKKVIVVEYERLKGILPEKVNDLIIANDELNYKYIEEILNELRNEISLTIIPFKSIGRSGMLFCFKPDYILIDYMDKKVSRNDILIGVYSGSLSKDMGYSGLLHFELIEGGIEIESTQVQV